MTCTGPSCTRPAIARGLCQAHYKQSARGQHLQPLRVSAHLDAQIVVRLPSALRTRIERAAKRQGVDASEWLRQVASEALAR